MAGEWIKMESNLPDKPETLAITAAMGWDDPDLTVGKLMRLFRWFDQQTVDGNAPGVTPALLDRNIGVTGFVQAVANSGWLVIESGGLRLNNFDRHNGVSAKKRAQTAKRVANFRVETKDLENGNAVSVTSALAREEKRREDKEREPRATRLPLDWTLPEEWKAYCETARPDLIPAAVAENFSDWWHAKAGKEGVKLDWFATWRGWVRKEAAKPAGRSGSRDGYVGGKHTRVVL